MVILKTIDDVCKYTSEVSREFPEISDEIAVVAKKGKLPKDLVSSLNLPESYVRIAENYRLAGVSIGYFSLWPSASVRPLSESLAEENSRHPETFSFHNKSLVMVALYEANPICVASTGAVEEGKVVMVDIMTSPVWKEISIASDFEKFLVLAASIYRVSDEFDGDPVNGLIEVGNCCAEFGCSPEQTLFWNARAQELLS